jgi:hypothetical protein
MTAPRWTSTNADKVRAELSRRFEQEASAASTTVPMWSAQRRGNTIRLAVAIFIALALVIPGSIYAFTLAGRTGPAGENGNGDPTTTPSLTTPDDSVTQTLPPGKLLGRFTSADGPNQNHTIRPGGLAIATQFVCTGDGVYSVFVAHGTSESGDGGCSGGGVGAGGEAVTGAATVKIRTDPDMRWTYTIIGIKPPARVELRPITTPTDSAGAAVPYCTSDDLAARYVAVPGPASDKSDAAGELVFTNRTDQTCALAGYPEVRFLSDGKPLGNNTMNQIDPRRSTDSGLAAVIVAPGASAYSQVDWYLPGANSRFEGTCVERAVKAVQVDLDYDLASPKQTGTISVPIGAATACLNGEHGALGKYGQISSTVFVDYSTQPKS